MIPSLETSSLEISEYASKTYDLDNSYTYIDDEDAVKQAVFLILNIQRYVYAIYSWNYGLEYEDLIGQPESLLYSELERRISEALLQDDRISSVTDFDFETTSSKTEVTFTVNSIYGSFEDGVTLNV